MLVPNAIMIDALWSRDLPPALRTIIRDAIEKMLMVSGPFWKLMSEIEVLDR